MSARTLRKFQSDTTGISLERSLAFQVSVLGLPEPTREMRFGALLAGGPGKGLRERLKGHNLKDWRFDFAWPDLRIACEIEGGTWTGGRHVTGKGFAEDCAKYNAAALHGWTVFRVTCDMVKSGEAASLLLRAISEKMQKFAEI